MKPIKIAHIITRMIVGGAQENTLHTCKEFSKDAAYEITLITGPSLGPEGDLLKSTSQNKSFKIILIPSLRRAINPFLDIIAFFKIWALCKKNKYDVVHTHSSKAGILGRWGAKCAGVKHIVHTVHGWGFHEYQPKWKKRLFIYLERITAKITTKIITVSQANTKKGEQNKIGIPSQYQTIYSGISLNQFKAQEKQTIKAFKQKNKIPSDRFIIGTAGRLVPQKNPLLIVEIMERLYKKNPAVYFIMIGDGPLRKKMEQLIKNHSLESSFLFTGLQESIENWIQTLDLFLLPSKWEGLPRALLQAMAGKKCVVASNADGISEVLENNRNGILLPSFSPDIWEETISELIKNPEKREQMGLNAEKTISNQFSDAKMIQDLKNLVQNLTGELA